MEKARLDKIIKNQDRLVYYSFNSYDEGVIFDSDIELGEDYAMFLQENKFNPDFLSKLSTENLMLVFSDGPRENQTYIIEKEIMKRVQNGEMIFGGNIFEMYTPFGKSMSSSDLMLNKFTKSNIELIEEQIRTKYDENLRYSNERAYKLLSKTDNLISKSNFLKYYYEGTISNKGLDMMEKIHTNDVSTFKKMNFGLLQDDFLILGEDIITHIAKYPELTQKVFMIKNNSSQLYDAFINEVNSIKSVEHISTVYEEIKRLLDSFAKNPNIIQNMSDKYDVIEIGLQDSPLFEEYLKNQDKDYDDFLDEKYKSFYKPRAKDKLKVFFAKYFSVSLEKAKELVEAYGEDIASVEQNLNKENSINILKEMQALLELEESEDLKKIDYLYENYKSKVSAKEMISFESDLREAYAKTYTKAFEKTRQKINNLIEEKSDRVSYVERNGKNIPIVKINGKFNIFMHSSDTGFKGDKTLKNNSFKESWCETEKPSQHLVATTNVDENFQGVAPIGKKGVYYGFMPQNPEHINLIGNQDINSNVRGANYKAEKAKYFSAEKMNYYSRRVYSEAAIEKCMPDYIVIYTDMEEANLENSYKAASEFDIPIICFDKRELVKQQTDNIKELMNEFRSNNSIDTLEMIIKTYETNKAGWLLNREKEDDEFDLTYSINNYEFKSEFDALGKEIGQVLRTFQKSAKSEDLLKLKDILSEQQELYRNQNENNVPFPKVKMTEEFKITLEDLSVLAISESITFEDVKQAEMSLEQIEHGIVEEKMNNGGEEYDS